MTAKTIQKLQLCQNQKVHSPFIYVSTAARFQTALTCRLGGSDSWICAATAPFLLLNVSLMRWNPLKAGLNKFSDKSSILATQHAHIDMPGSLYIRQKVNHSGCVRIPLKTADRQKGLSNYHQKGAMSGLNTKSTEQIGCVPFTYNKV